jgi:hypothetical protein
MRILRESLKDDHVIAPPLVAIAHRHGSARRSLTSSPIRAHHERCLGRLYWFVIGSPGAPERRLSI